MVFPIPTFPVPAGYEDIYNSITAAIVKSVTKSGYQVIETVHSHLFGVRNDVPVSNYISNVAIVLATEFIPNLSFKLSDVKLVRTYRTQEELKSIDVPGWLSWFTGSPMFLPFAGSFAGIMRLEDEHLEYLLTQWYLLTMPAPEIKNGEIATKWSDIIVELPKHAVYWLCCGILSPMTLGFMSDSYGAWLYCALTGRVIMPSHDPSILSSYSKWNAKMSATELCKINYGYLLTKKTVDTWRDRYTTYVGDHVTTDVYHSLLEDKAKPIMDFVEEYLESVREDVEGGDFALNAWNTVVKAGMQPSMYIWDKSASDPNSEKIGYRNYIFSDDILSLFVHIYVDKNKIPRPPMSLHYSSLVHYNDFEILRVFGGFQENEEGKSIDAAYYGSRRSFLQIVIAEFSHSKWKRSNTRKCINGSLPHYITAAPRNEEVAESAVNSEGLDDPVLTYGPLNDKFNAKCYQVSELMAAFDDYVTGFEFRDPDWNPEVNRIDPYTGMYIKKFMSAKQITLLLRYLREVVESLPPLSLQLPNNTPMVELKDKIEDGLNSDKRLRRVLKLVRNAIEPGARQYYAVKHFFEWLFLFSMYIRFWKGPGYPYPANWSEQNEDTCLYKQRDENVIIELKVFDLLMAEIEQETRLKDFLLDLPYVYHSWATGESKVTRPEVGRELMGAYTIGEVIQKIREGNFCMAQATDILSGTAFVYLTKGVGSFVEDVTDGVDGMILIYGLNTDLVNVMIYLADMEAKAVRDRERELLELGLPLNELHEHENAYAAVNNIQFTAAAQPPLDFSSITVSNHLPFDIQRMDLGLFG